MHTRSCVRSLAVKASMSDYSENRRTFFLPGPAAEAKQIRDRLCRLLVDSVTEYAIFALDAEGYIVSWNPGAERTKGYTEAEILGRHFSVLHPPEEVNAGKPLHALRIAAAEGRFEDEGWRLRKDGSRFRASVVITALRNAGGDLLGFGEVTRDITERQEAQQRGEMLIAEQARRAEAEAGEAQIAGILESITDGFCSVDREWRYTYVNREAERLLGRSREDLLGKSMWEVFPDAVGTPSYQECHRAMQEQQPAHYEVLYEPSGLWYENHVYPSQEGISIYFRETTARKLTEQALRHSEERLRKVIESAQEAFVSMDAEGIIIDWNPEAERTFGWPKAQAVGKSMAELIIPPRHREAHRRGFERFLKTGEARVLGQRLELTALHSGGHEFPIEFSTSVVLQDGEPLFHAFLHDISDRKRAEDEARRRNGYIEMLQKVAVIANEAPNLEEALQRSLAVVCGHTGWPVGHAQVRDGNEMVSTGLWAMDDAGRLEPFRRASEQLRFGPGVGLVGQSLVTGRPTWIADVAEDPKFVHAPVAREVGITSAFCFPVVTGNEMAAALEFFSDVSAEPDEPLLAVMAHIGTQLGRVVERERATKQIKEAVERYELVGLAANDPIMDWDLVADRVTLNQAARMLFGSAPRPEQAGSEWWLEHIHPDDRQRVQSRLEATLHSRENIFMEEFRFRCADGSYANLLDRGYLLRDSRGRAIRKVESMVDITRQKQAEERKGLLAEVDRVLALQFDFDARLKSLAKVVARRLADYCLVDLVGEDGEIRRVEAAHAHPGKKELVRYLLEHPPIHARPSGPSMVIRTGEPILLPRMTEQFLKEDAQDESHTEILSQLGPASCMVVPLKSRGRTLGALTFVRTGSSPAYGRDDLALAAELGRHAGVLLDNARLHGEARAAVRAREEVLAVVSHELRNPLQAILLGIDGLFTYVPAELRPPKERQHLEFIQHATAQMSRLVADLLDVMRIEAGHLTVRRYREEVAAVIGDVAGLFQPLAERRSCRLEVSVPEGLPTIFVDRQRIFQVLSNLIGNAIRVTPENGVITLKASAVREGIRFSVTDTGPGIPEEHLPHLFNRFWQGSHSARGSAGLGLSIAEAIIEAHKGRIWVQSQPGEGSTFSFTVPTAAADAATAPDTLDDEEINETFARLASTNPPEGATAPAQSSERRSSAQSRGDTLADPVLPGQAGASAEARSALVNYLRDQITYAVHLGHLRAGDRLPSIRDLGRQFGATHHAVVQAYDALSMEGLVEKRGRSGVYVAPLEASSVELRADAARWLAGVLVGACEQGIRIPYLPELLRRWTASIHLRCACIDSDGDHRTAFCAEVTRQFGLDSTPVAFEALPHWEAGQRVDVASLPRELKEADLFITTAFHAPTVRAIAETLGKPVVVATVNPETVDAVEHHLRNGQLTVICTDPAFAERVRALRGGMYKDQIRVIFADDAEAIAALDRSEPVFLTLAAHRQLGSVNLRTLVPHSQSFSPAFERNLSEAIIQLNLEALRV